MNCHHREDLQEALGKNPACYVLITCGELSEDGQMQVDMTYKGDLTLISYLIYRAQHFIDQAEQQDAEWNG